MPVHWAAELGAHEPDPAAVENSKDRMALRSCMDSVSIGPYDVGMGMGMIRHSSC